MTSPKDTRTPAPDGTPADGPAPVDTLSFEQALAELESIVRQLEAGSVDLECAVRFYERGVALRRRCETRLAEARMSVESIARSPDGDTALTPFRTE